ncbi:hypothetical protein EJB05_34823, partial [Eragrostis curvula]
MENQLRFLPEELLADILGRLAPRSLAVSRCVCKAWRAIVDGHHLLRPDLLPLTLGGIFISLTREAAPSEFFAPPFMGPKIASKLQNYVCMMDYCWDIPHIIGCCNGLLLLDGIVVNPATQRWARLPPCPPSLPDGTTGFGFDDAYLAFDPVLSPHYEVVLIKEPLDYDKTLLDRSEWPPPLYKLCVYSSETGRWEEKPFVREGGPAGTVSAVRSASEPEYRHSACWHGALYIHCTSDFIMRVNLSSDKYRVIKLPSRINSGRYDELYLGKSKKGVYGAFLHGRCRLQVLFLNESGDEAKWVSKHDIDLEAVAHFSPDQYPWILHEGNLDEDNNTGGIMDENLRWDSDNDDVLDTEEKGAKCHYGHVSIFGFHPYKEIVFLYVSNARVVACHLNSPKIQDVGQLQVKYRDDVINTTFVYMPCLFGDLS